MPWLSVYLSNGPPGYPSTFLMFSTSWVWWALRHVQHLYNRCMPLNYWYCQDVFPTSWVWWALRHLSLENLLHKISSHLKSGTHCTAGLLAWYRSNVLHTWLFSFELNVSPGHSTSGPMCNVVTPVLVNNLANLLPYHFQCAAWPLCYRSNVPHSRLAPLLLVQCATLRATQLWVPHGYQGTAYRSNFSASLLYSSSNVPIDNVPIVLKCHLAPCLAIVLKCHLAILLLVYIYCPFCTQHCFDGFRKILVKWSTGTLLLTFVKGIVVSHSFNILSSFYFRSYEIIIFRLKHSPAKKVIHRALALPVGLSLQA